jgi:biotin carboxyl carrier protein
VYKMIIRRKNMKKFLIKVNGNQYEVEVEEIRDSSAATTPAAAVQSAPAPAAAAPVAPAAPAAAAAPAPSAVAPPSGDATKVEAPMPGTVLSVAVKEGEAVKRNQVLLILEAMKMENEIVAPVDGTVSGIAVAKGTTVNAGDLLLYLS